MTHKQIIKRLGEIKNSKNSDIVPELKTIFLQEKTPTFLLEKCRSDTINSVLRKVIKQYTKK